MPRAETSRRYYLANRERLLAARRAHRAANRERIIREQADYRERNRETLRAKARRRYAAERVERIAAVTAYSKTEAGKETDWRRKQRRRARKRGAFVEDVVRLVVLERDDGVCGICGGDVDPTAFELDHVVALALGGEHSYANVQVAHPLCNRRKSARALEEVMPYHASDQTDDARPTAA